MKISSWIAGRLRRVRRFEEQAKRLNRFARALFNGFALTRISSSGHNAKSLVFPFNDGGQPSLVPA